MITEHGNGSRTVYTNESIPTGLSTCGNLISCPVLIQVIPIRFTALVASLFIRRGNLESMSILIECKQPFEITRKRRYTMLIAFRFRDLSGRLLCYTAPLKSFGSPPPGRLVRSADLGAIASEFPNKNELSRSDLNAWGSHLRAR
jgi:hypothetical protein